MHVQCPQVLMYRSARGHLYCDHVSYRSLLALLVVEPGLERVPVYLPSNVSLFCAEHNKEHHRL